QHLRVQTGGRPAVVDSTAKPERPVRESIHAPADEGRMKRARRDTGGPSRTLLPEMPNLTLAARTLFTNDVTWRPSCCSSSSNRLLFSAAAIAGPGEAVRGTQTPARSSSPPRSRQPPCFPSLRQG